MPDQPAFSYSLVRTCCPLTESTDTIEYIDRINQLICAFPVCILGLLIHFISTVS